MKKPSAGSYKALFFKHVERFLGNVTTPHELAGPHALAVSGGVDSMVLLWFAHELHLQGKIGPIRALFVHHHTRAGQSEDARLVEKFSQQLGIDFRILQAQGLGSVTGNFEAVARKARRSLLLNHLKEGELLWLGHHLDDSYEWSIMQRYRSGLPKSSLGIPVRNGRILRPFLCVSKKQLLSLSRFEKVPFREDPTNRDTKFDRNFLREEIIPLIKKRYPQYLKHYVNHANHMAAILNLSITTRVSDGQIHLFDQGALIQGSHFSSHQVQELLHTFSHSQRGKLTSQILKMQKAIENGKKGPFHFSGGTEIYSSYKLLMIYKQNFKNYDQAIAKVLRGISDSQLRTLPKLNWEDLQHTWDNLLKTSDAMLNMPGMLLVMENDSLGKLLNTSVYDSLFPEVSQFCKERHFRIISSLKCLEVWKKKKTKLPEMLGLLPLWTLSNLFSSQE